MTNTFVYLAHDDNPYLLHAWLQRQGEKINVCLLSDHPAAVELIAEFPTIHSLVDLRGPSPFPEHIRTRIQQDSVPELLIPRAPDRIPMRYQPKTLMSDFSSWMPLLRKVWQWGFRAIRCLSHQGEERLEVPHLLESFHNRHQGQRCFVVGNGPSLQQLDMPRLRDEITLGSNRCFLGYPQWGFPFRYWGVYDKFQIEQYHSVYESHVPSETVKFLPLEYASVIQADHTCPVDCQWPRQQARAFSDDPAQCYVGFTVTYMLLQIAAIMGCDPIILIGVDHRYDLKQRGYSRWVRQARRAVTRRLRGGRIYETARAAHRGWQRHGARTGTPALWSTDDATHPTHFTASYTDGGKNQFLPPEPEEAERDFACAQQWTTEHGRTIVNATPGSALTTFPTIDFDDLFR